MVFTREGGCGDYNLPTNQNSFSVQLSHLGFNIFSIFVVDFMHEVELGTWKSLFLHLLRMLDTMDGALNKLDSRYAALFISFASINAFFRFREMPTFGRDSIRCFSSHVSELKKLAAHDYENLLQVGIGRTLSYFLRLTVIT